MASHDRIRIFLASGLGALLLGVPGALFALDPATCPKESFAEERLELTIESVTVDGVPQTLPVEPEDGFVLLYEDRNLLYGRLYDPDAGARDRLLELGR